jgi:hypothetical protein
MSQYEKKPRWIEVDLSMYVAHWTTKSVIENEDMAILYMLLKGVLDRCTVRVAECEKQLLELGEQFDKPMRVIDSRNPEARMQYVLAKRHQILLRHAFENLRRTAQDNGLVHYRFSVYLSVPLKDAEWSIRHTMLSDIFELVGYYADNLLDKKQIEEEENGPLNHEREMYYMHLHGVRSSMERLVRGHDQWNNFKVHI